MEISRNVILDLLPLYLADEASDDSKTLVREHLENDPDLAHLASQWQQRLTAPPPAPVRPEAEALAYQAAQKAIAIKTVGIAVVLTVAIALLSSLTALVLIL